jgi:hypothetical protein
MGNSAAVGLDGVVWRRRTVRGCPLRIGLLCAAVGLTLASGSATASDLEHVIPPGQEALLETMLGLGVTLPGNCQFTNGNAQGVTVTAEYVCAQGSVVLELRFPDDAPSAAPRTEQFAIVVRSGSAPAELVDALASRIRAHEAGFHWKELAKPPSLLSRSIRLVGAAAAISGILLLGLALQFLVRRRLPAAGTWPHSAVGAAVLAVISAGALCTLVHVALRTSGTLSSALLWDRPDR